MKLNLFILLTIITVSCGGVDNNEERSFFLEILDAKIISEYPEKLGGNYLVYPYYVDFDFSDFLSKKMENHPSREKIAKDIFTRLDIDIKEFVKIKKGVNQKYKELYSDNLYDLSIGNESTLMFTFSGLSKNLIFVNLYWYYDAISKEDLTENFDFQNNLYSINSFIVFLDSDKKKIKKVVYDNSCTIEQWPDGKISFP